MKEEVKETWIEKFGRKLSKSVESWMPDPLIFALLLSIITALMALLIIQPYTKLGPSDTLKWLFLDSWYKGFWELLTFAMQMVLILVTGYAVAYHPLVYRGLRRLATYPKKYQASCRINRCNSYVLCLDQLGFGANSRSIISKNNWN